MSSRLIQYTDSIDYIWEEAVYTEARLLADKHAAKLAPRMSAYVEQVEGVRSGQYRVWRGELVAQAHVDVADEKLDGSVLAVGDALDRSGDDRDAPRRKRYLGERTARKIAAQGLESELTVVRAWPDSLATEEEAQLQAQADPMREAVAAGDAAVGERAKAQNTRRDFMARDKAKLVDGLNDLRTELHAELARKVVPQKLARTWPDGFFRRGTSAKGEKSAEGDEKTGGAATKSGEKSAPRPSTPAQPS